MMKTTFLLIVILFGFSAFAESDRELILALKTKEVMDTFRDKKDMKEKDHAIMEFVKSLKPLCLQVAKVKWGTIPEAELKKMDKEVGVFIGGMSDYQIKFRADETADLTQTDRAEIKRTCREIEKRSMN